MNRFQALIAAALFTGSAQAGEVFLRYLPQEAPQTYRTIFHETETLVRPGGQTPLKDLKLASEVTRRQRPLGDEGLRVEVETKPTAMMVKGKALPLAGVQDLLTKTSRYGMTDLGELAPGATARWAPTLPDKAVKVGATWTQRLTTGPAAGQEIRLKLAGIKTRAERRVARILFKGGEVRSNPADGTRSKWSMKGWLELDVDGGFLVGSSTSTTLLVKYPKALEDGTNRFKRQVRRSVALRPVADEVAAD